MKNKLIQYALFSTAIVFLHITLNSAHPLYFCTAADKKFYPYLLNLIGSIHKVNFEDLGQIAVFDLGFTKEQRETLDTIQKVVVCDVELTHPDLLTPFAVRPKGRKYARGWYAWKPVVIKQALNMFPYILYLDAGVLILNPINDLFEHIRQNNYFFVRSQSNDIRWMITTHVIEKFNLLSDERRWILDQKVRGISANLQGLTRALYNDYALPMYELSKDLKNFADNGTTAGGFGTGRHDQALSSIHVLLLGLKVMAQGHLYLRINDKRVLFQVTADKNRVCEKTHIYLVRRAKAPDFTQFIKYQI